MEAGEHLTVPELPPNLHLPSSPATVKVHIIDSTSTLVLPTNALFSRPIPGLEKLTIPSYSFLISHASGQHLLWDLGVRSDAPAGFVPSTAERLRAQGWTARASQDVVDILSSHGIAPDAITAVLWSHQHFDHTGDVALFPKSTRLVVGPGFKQQCTPGWPEDADAKVKEEDWAGRDLVEVSFDDVEEGKEQSLGGGNRRKPLRIGRFRALDYFADGSFYLLETPGHTHRTHMCALARTTTAAAGPEDSSSSSSSSSFVLLGGDVAHHPGEFRPSRYAPLPRMLVPDPLGEQESRAGRVFQEIQRSKSAAEPMLEMKESMPDDREQALWALEGIEEFDALDNVLVAIAHDASFAGEECFPDPLNGWMEKGWKQKMRWKFLSDFKGAVKVT